MTEPNLIIQITQELKLAALSQERGNEGKARVCARRAAGWAIQEYLRQQEISIGNNNALDHIKYFAAQNGHSPQIAAVLHHLLVKLEKESLESDAYYPIQGVDLVREAQWLVEELLQTKLDLS